jgi:hypothetical protein
MHTMSFDERAHSLENAFFHEVDKKLLEKMRQQLQEQEASSSLHSISGIQDDALVAELVEIGVRPETLSAVALIPLVMATWADGKPDDKERKAILAVEREAGIETDAPSHRLLEHWLQKRPDDKLMDVWEHYVISLRGKVSDNTAQTLEGDILARVKAISKVSGGYLTYGAISPGEQKIIKRVQQALKRAKRAATD